MTLHLAPSLSHFPALREAWSARGQSRTYCGPHTAQLRPSALRYSPLHARSHSNTTNIRHFLPDVAARGPEQNCSCCRRPSCGSSRWTPRPDREVDNRPRASSAAGAMIVAMALVARDVRSLRVAPRGRIWPTWNVCKQDARTCNASRKLLTAQTHLANLCPS